ncbi:MAG: Fic family protein [Nitrospirae bacterium]|nr:MAG: Fic family protein [Nitrospirota bacterium]
MKSFENKYLSELAIPHHLITIIRQIGEYKGKQDLYKKQAPEMLENLRHVAIIQSTESSNRLEGITADIQRIKELVEDKTKPANRSEAEIAGYRDVLSTIHSNYEHISFSKSVILQFHRDLMKYSGKEGGRWKSASNEITEILPDGTKRIRFVPVAPHLTADYMKELHDLYDTLEKEGDIDPLILIALYVLDFLCVHPFLDGNGRMARLITVLLLYRYGYEVGRFISIERVIEQTKESYYETLQTSSQGWHEGKHDALPWVEYALSTVLAAYKEFETRFTRISSGRGSKTDIVLNTIDSIIGDFSVSDLQSACPDVSIDMIRHVLKKLKKEEKVISLGQGRAARWRKIK